MADPRIGRLNKLFNSILKGETQIVPRTAKQFLEAICEQPSPTDCISRIVASPNGLGALQQSLSSDSSLSFVNDILTRFIEYIKAEELQTLCKGDPLRRVFNKVVESELLWEALVQAARSQTLDPPALSAFAWLLTQLLSLPAEDAVAYLSVAQDANIQRSLLQSTEYEHRVLGQRIVHIAQTLSGTSHSTKHHLPPDEPGPGGRHDNDFAEIQKISIFPTADELATPDVYLPLAHEVQKRAHGPDGLAMHIDAQFRLLREDMLRSLREEISTATQPRSRGRKPFVIRDLALAGALCNDRQPWALRLRCTKDLPQLVRMKTEEREKYLKANWKFVKHGSLACLMVNQQIITLATLVRDDDLLSEVPSSISVQISSKGIENVLGRLKDGGSKISLLQVDTAMFAYEPVLHELKETRELSLGAELLMWQAGDKPSSPSYNLKPGVVSLLQTLKTSHDTNLQPYLDLPTPTRLDQAQSLCFRAALEQRVAVMQGPPGTGKSFIGSLVGKTIYKASKERILVVCYTHHALDDFLESLMDLGISDQDIVRLGSNQKATARTKGLSLYDQRPGGRFSAIQQQMMDAAKSELEEQGSQLCQSITKFCSFNPGPKDLMEYLEFVTDDMPFYDAFQLPEDAMGMQRVGKSGKAVGQYYLLDRWRNGLDAGQFNREVNTAYSSIWNLSQDVRQSKYRQWMQELLQEHLTSVQEQGRRYDKALTRKNSVYLERDLGVMLSKRIIACTTTAAAKYSEQLRTIAPGVLLVEEAGEILESHILTALGPKMKQLILIGDHKQLRPKCNHDLSVEKGLGYDLNRSLFERLVLNGFPHQSLFSQHRMRPEISSLIRELTYPDLTDAEKTRGRPDLRGFTDNLIFVNHDEPETEPSGANDPAKSSKQNLFEAHMALRCIRYLAQQGYKSDDLVVLTPYLGQLKLLSEELKQDHDPVLSDLDSHELVKAGLMPAATAKLNKSPLRISTIDNYQGEEAKVVVISLTRSNKNNDIGFMYAPERLNVLLSRARDAMIMIGNAEHFMRSRKGGELWTRLITMLTMNNHIYDGFPVHCEKHPDRKSLLRKPSDFDAECPDGGCQEPCGILLNCDVHKCPKRCHILLDHSNMDCEAIIESKCPKGHLIRRMCFRPDSNTCRRCNDDDEKARQLAAKMLKEQEDQQRHTLQIQEIERQIQALKDQAEIDQATRDREAVLQQKKQDLETTRARIQKQAAERVRNAERKAAEAAQKAQKSHLPSNEPSDRPHGKTAQPLSDADGSKTNEKSPQDPSGNGASSSKSSPRQGTPEPVPQTDRPEKDWSVPASVAEQDWDFQKNFEGASNKAIDALMALTGLETVKSKMLAIKAKIEATERRGDSLSKERLGVTMLGNPGTGKTTVARIYADFLCSVEAISGSEFLEVSGSSLANDGVSGTKKKIDGLATAGGGVFFLDEAYQLASGNSHNGKAVLDFLLAEIEERRGVIVFILAGYRKDMEKFFEHNPGFDSRMPNRFNFEDYSDAELLKMLASMVEKKYNKQAMLSGGPRGLASRILVTRLGRRRGSPGYGNARDLENVWARVTERQADRLKRERRAGWKPDDFFFSRTDVIGPEPSVAIKDSKAWKKLNELIGLNSVKKSVQSFLDRVQLNYRRELDEKKPVMVSLNRLFLGSPGTGKTSVAKLYATILTEMGLLSKGEVVLKTPADFVGAVIGESEKNTKAILQASEGKVLVIDEAYGLNPAYGSKGGNDPFKTAVIDTIVADVQSVPGEDRCVLLLGYTDQMREMFRNANPGLSRRFPDADAFYFEDFDDADLRKILDLNLKNQDLSATSEAKNVAVSLLARARDKSNFGNAGEVENLLSRAKDNWQKRMASGEAQFDPNSSNVNLDAEDFDPDYDRGRLSAVSVQSLFADIVGLDQLIQNLEGWQKMTVNMKARDQDPRQLIPFSFVFKGPPGTGKTTVARRIGVFYYQIGILSTTDFVECSAEDLVGQYVGHTAPKTKEVMNSALGKVLFIDEAYRLKDSQFGREAINEIVDCLTKPKYIDKLVVILAGYTDDINELLRVNSGLASRFPEEVFFESMSPDRCLALLHRLLISSSLDVTADLQDSQSTMYRQLVKLLNKLSPLPSWGNGRDITTLSKKITATALQNAGTGPSPVHVTNQDVLLAVNTMLSEQQARATGKAKPDNPIGQLTKSMENMNIPPSVGPPKTGPPKSKQDDAMEGASGSESPPGTPLGSETGSEDIQPPSDENNAERDYGVTDAKWEQLQRDTATAQVLARQAQADIRAEEKAAEAACQEAEAKQQEIERLETLARKQREEDDAREKAEEDDLRRKLEEARIRAIELKRAQDAREARLRAIRKAEAERQRQEQEAQRKLRDMGVCPVGFQWVKQASGYRCAGGSHFVDNGALGL